MKKDFTLIKELICEEKAIAKIGHQFNFFRNQRAIFNCLSMEDAHSVCGYIEKTEIENLPQQDFRLSLTFACRDNYFVKIQGRASIQDAPAGVEQNQHAVFLRIAVREAYCFKKQKLSLHTSFLKNIFSFHYRRPEVEAVQASLQIAQEREAKRNRPNF